MERFNASIGFDRRLLEVDVAGSKVYARALERAGLLTPSECGRILEGLDQVLRELSAPDHEFHPEVEDVHMAVEARLTGILGPLGGKLHAGRSRNDQVSLDEAPLPARRHRRHRPAHPPAAGSPGGLRPGPPPDRPARLHAPAAGAADPVRPLRPVLVLGPGPGSRPAGGRPAPQRPHAPRLRRPGGFRLRPRPRVHGAGARVLGGDPQQPRRGLRPRLPPGGPGGAVDPDDAPEPLLRGPGPVLLGRVRLRRARRRLGHRLEHDAPEEEPGLPGAGPRQDGARVRRPALPADGDEGPRPDLRQGPAGGQGARLRRLRHGRRLFSRSSPRRGRR